MIGFGEIRAGRTKQDGSIWRLTGMRAHVPGLIAITARTAGMVGLAILLILVLLPAALAAQAATG